MVKAVELIREIRDKHYKETKALSVNDQIRFIRKKAKELQRSLKSKDKSLRKP